MMRHKFKGKKLILEVTPGNLGGEVQQGRRGEPVITEHN